MKKMFVSFLLCAGTALAVASSTPEITVVDAGHKSFVLYVDDARSNLVHVTIKDTKGVVLLTDRVKNPEPFACKYNLVNLPEGDYILVVEDGPKTVAQPITIGAKELAIPTAQMEEFFAPSVQVNHNKLDFTMLCPEPTPVTIKIVDEIGRENYAATTLEKGSVQRRFDISALTPGKYTVVTKVQGENLEKVYREVFTIGADIAAN